MQLIRKRLKVEFWLDEQLKFLYNIQVNLFEEKNKKKSIPFIFYRMMIIPQKIMKI